MTTITPVINAQPFGISGVGGGVKSVAELDPSTTSVVLQCIVTLGDAAANRSTRLHVRYAWSPTAYATPDLGMQALSTSSRYIELPLAPTHPTLVMEQSSLPIPVPGGGYMYIWSGSPILPTQATLTVNVIESQS